MTRDGGLGNSKALFIAALDMRHITVYTYLDCALKNNYKSLEFSFMGIQPTLSPKRTSLLCLKKNG